MGPEGFWWTETGTGSVPVPIPVPEFPFRGPLLPFQGPFFVRSSFRSRCLFFSFGTDLEQTRSKYRYYRSSYRSWHRSWSVPSPFLAPFLISSTFCSHTLRVRVWVWDPQMGADWCLWAQCIQEVPWGAQQARCGTRRWAQIGACGRNACRKFHGVHNRPRCTLKCL